MAAPTRRVNRGGGHAYFLDDEQVPGVTTILGDGVPKPALVNWAATTTAGYAVDNWADLAELTPSKRLRELERARYAERDAAANRGTKIHALAHELAAGVEVDVPEEIVGHVDAYLEFAEAYGVVELVTEATVVNRTWRYMGTLDALVEVDGEVWLVDWKSGGKGIYPEVALQLAAYAYAETYLDGDVERPLPNIDRAVAVWLRADGYDVYPVDISPSTFRTFLYAQQVAKFTTADRATYIGDALEPRRLEVAS